MQTLWTVAAEFHHRDLYDAVGYWCYDLNATMMLPLLLAAQKSSLQAPNSLSEWKRVPISQNSCGHQPLQQHCCPLTLHLDV